MNFRKVKFILKVKAKINNLEMLNILKVKIVAGVMISLFKAIWLIPHALEEKKLETVRVT